MHKPAGEKEVGVLQRRKYGTSLNVSGASKRKLRKTFWGYANETFLIVKLCSENRVCDIS